jgi:hypothetical protein
MHHNSSYILASGTSAGSGMKEVFVGSENGAVYQITYEQPFIATAANILRIVAININ